MWGDLRYDHSDIFNPEPKPRKPPGAPVKPTTRVIGQRVKIVEFVASCGDRGASAKDVAKAIGQANPRGRTSTLLRELVAAGHLRRVMVDGPSDQSGQRPYTYFIP